MSVYRHDPYRFQVHAPEDSVVVVIDGQHIGALSRSSNTICLTSKKLHEGENGAGIGGCRLAHIVCYTPVRLQEMNMHVILHVGRSRMDLGCLTNTQVITAMRYLGKEGDSVLFTLNEIEDAPVPYSMERRRILSTVLQIFHDHNINPSFGALRLEDIHSVLMTRDRGENPYAHISRDQSSTLASLLLCHKDICHMYTGKDNDTWVVLHSHSKRVNIPPEHARLYASLLRTIVEELGNEEKCLADLFRVVSKNTAFHPLLASNFTILKKFLIKYNKHFVWFQDEKTRTTKVMLQKNDGSVETNRDGTYARSPALKPPGGHKMSPHNRARHRGHYTRPRARVQYINTAPEQM